MNECLTTLPLTVFTQRNFIADFRQVKCDFALFTLGRLAGKPASTPPVGPEFCGATHLRIASLGAHHRRTAVPALAACPGTCRLQSCRAHVQGLKRPRAAVPVVGFYPCCRCAVSTSTPLGVYQPTAGVVLPAVHDRTEGVALVSGTIFHLTLRLHGLLRRWPFLDGA